MQNILKKYYNIYIYNNRTENIILIDIWRMDKSTAYRNSKALAIELGYNVDNERSWIGSTKTYWLNRVEILQGVVTARRQHQTRTRQFQAELRRQFELRQANIDIVKFRTKTQTLRGNSRIVDYIHDIPEALRLAIDNDSYDDVRSQVYNIANIHSEAVIGHKARIMVDYIIYEEDGTNRVISSSIPYINNIININTLVNQFMQREVRRLLNHYNDRMEIIQITISVFYPNDELMGSSVRTIAQANDTWLMVSPKSLFNCLFQALAITRNYNSNIKLLEMSVEGQDARTKSGCNLKAQVSTKYDILDNYADNKSIQAVADYTKYPIKLYNNLFKNISPKVWLCKGNVWKYQHEANDKIFKNGKEITSNLFRPIIPLKRYKGVIKEYEIQRVDNHCIALIRKKDLLKIHPNKDIIPKKYTKKQLERQVIPVAPRNAKKIFRDDMKEKWEEYEKKNKTKTSMEVFEFWWSCLPEIRKKAYIMMALLELKRYNKELTKFRLAQPYLSMAKDEKKKSNFCDIIKRKPDFGNGYNWKIASWDLETTKDKNNKHIPYACGLSWNIYIYGEPKSDEQKQFFEDTRHLQFREDYEDKIYITTKQDKMRCSGRSYGWIVKNKPDFAEWHCNQNTQHTKYFRHLCKRKIIGSIRRTKQFWGLNCLQKFTDYLASHKETFNGYTLYAHNGGKYDLPLAIEKAFLDTNHFIIEGKGCVELNNAWIGFTLRGKDDNKFKIKFRDSMRILPMSLEKLCKELKVKHQKLPETVNHNQITLINYKMFPEMKKYLKHDVLGLLEVMEEFGRSVYKELGIDITKCLTGATLSKKNFFKNYYKPEKNPVYTLTPQYDKFVRDSYFGGRVEVFKIGEISKAYYYDFTSLYPDVGRNYLPYGDPIDYIITLPSYRDTAGVKAEKHLSVELLNEINSRNEDNWVYYVNQDEDINVLPKAFFGWCKVLVKTKRKDTIPKHSMLKDGRLIFPIFENWTEINVFSEEMDYDQYEYKLLELVRFKKAMFKRSFFDDGFMNKAKAKASGNPAMAQAYKIIINSGYGFWGLRTKDRDGVIISEPNSKGYMQYLNTDKLLGIREYKDYTICRVLKDLDIRDFNVAVAAAISSYARSKLHSMLIAIRKVGGQLYYCDTDSVICDINIKDYPEIQQKFQWDGDGSELGSLKNECDEKIEGLLKSLYPDDKPKQKDIFKDLIKKENGNLSFDRGVITGCKQYALTKTVNIEGKDHTVEIVKLKGYSQRDTDSTEYKHDDLMKPNELRKSINSKKVKNKLNFDDMVNMNLGLNLSQQQTQFRCPKSNYVSDTQAFSINSEKITKSFRRTYTKGQIFNNYVLPLRI